MGEDLLLDEETRFLLHVTSAGGATLTGQCHDHDPVPHNLDPVSLCIPAVG